ncbi:MAG: protocatechuate 3,4-dioxygenase subunit alpha [Pseudomonadota bacterium]
MEPLETRRTRPAQSNAAQPYRETASQTAGPYVHIGCLPQWAGLGGVFLRDLVANTDDTNPPAGELITIEGHVIDGAGEICRDVMLEFWHCQPDGTFDPGIWRRSATDLATGTYIVETIMPGSSGENAPFIAVWITARGINTGLLTRIYFPEFSDANGRDPDLAMIDPKRHLTLMAAPGTKPGQWTFDVHLQGEDETVFFDI